MPLPPGWYDPYAEEEEMPWTSPVVPIVPTLPPVPGIGEEESQQLGPVTPDRPFDPYYTDWREPPDAMTWQTFASRVSPDTMAQLFTYWNEGVEPSAEARSELLTAGLDWYQPFQWGGPPDSYTKKYMYDLQQMYENALRRAGYSTPRVRVPGLSRELANTGMGPWYNYRPYRGY